MYLLIVFLPLLASLFSGFFGRYLGFRGSCLITTTSVIISAFLSTIVFYEVCLCGSFVSIKLYPWFISEIMDVSWGFYFDSITCIMLIVILYVSSLVHLYSISYMYSDPHLSRFMCYLSIFTFFMLCLVTSDNFIQMFFGWEGVGLASYLLISFWFTRLQASKSSIKAMLMNRIGDFGLLLGIMGVYSIFKTVDFLTVFSLAGYFSDTYFIFCNYSLNSLNTICILLFIGSIGKSAQIPLHTWLPDAMEGPTPVSALIHAATMVTAGVFMIVRLSPLFEFASFALSVVAIIGSMTCFFAATTGMVQNDLKRVIAYSTCSQLGYMIFACGISNYSVAMFHLMNHAFFKALLFLSAGSVIHALSDMQDMRKMGGIVKMLPFTYAMMLIGSLSLAGFPFLTGFYSKDLILELAYAKYTISSNFGYILLTTCVLLTSYYSFRLLFLTFLTENSLYKKTEKKIYANSQSKIIKNIKIIDADLITLIPLVLLCFGSIFVGYIFKDMTVGLGTNFWYNSIFILPKNVLLLESEYINQNIKFIPLILTILGLILCFFIFYEKTCTKKINYLKQNKIILLFYYMFNKRWFFDKVYNDFILKNFMKFGYNISFKKMDKGFFELLGPFGIYKFFKIFTLYLIKLQSGMIYHYALIMLLGLTFLIYAISLWDYFVFFLDTKYYILYLITFLFYNFYLNFNKKF